MVRLQWTFRCGNVRPLGEKEANGGNMKRRAQNAEPVHVTAWDDIWCEDGVLHVAFKSGPQRYLLVMGPFRAFEGMERAKKALAAGEVIPFPRVRGAQTPPDPH